MAVSGKPIEGYPDLYWTGAALSPEQEQVSPTLLQRLEKLAKESGRKLYILSGYRPPAYNKAVGGAQYSAHTRHIAADVVTAQGQPIGQVYSLGQFQAVGLRSGNVAGFFQGKPDPEHVDLVGQVGQPTGTRLSLAQLWIAAGGPKQVAPIMAAIATAESGGRINAQHKNTNGSVDYGLWQINSVHSMYDPAKLMSNPLYNARAAVAIYNSQGLGAWTTYTSGAYKKYLGSPATISGDGGGGGGGFIGGVTGAIGDAGHAVYDASGRLIGYSVGDAIHDVGKATGLDALAAPIDAIKWVLDPDHLKRLGMILLGAAMLLVGLNMFSKVAGGPSVEASDVAMAAATKGAK